ncbi:MAG: hypothetical protein Q9195_007039 [Heterodermia aff. obscurata]
MASAADNSSDKYPAKAHAAKVAAHLTSLDTVYRSATIYIEAQKTRLLEDNDEAEPFSDDVIWSGLPLSPSEALTKYDVDAVLTTSDLPSHLASLSPAKLLHLDNHDIPAAASSAAHHPAPTPEDKQALRNALETSRITKTPYEIALLRHANEITTAAHTAVLRSLKHKHNERELEAVFTERCIALGAPKQAYHGIFGSGTNAATLHYVHNDKALGGKLNVLVDAAAEYRCYCADVTRTMPLSGEFTRESREVYGVVERMQGECLGMLRAGVLWEDVHVRAHEVAIEGLLSLGILKGGSVGEIFERGTSVAFFPHGLGHYLGMDTHDVGGNPNYADKDKMFRYLRVRGKLPKDCVITVEPGVYFCRFIVEPYLKDEKHKGFIDEGVLNKYWDVGGVRIEDDILVTEDGYENLTTAPKTVEDMERIIRS